MNNNYVNMNAWIRKMYDKNIIKVSSREYYKRLSYEFTGTRDNAWQLAWRKTYV